MNRICRIRCSSSVRGLFQAVSLACVVFFCRLHALSYESPPDYTGTIPELHLIVNFWAPDKKLAPHRVEVRASIAINMANEHINIVRLLLESTPTYTCKESSSELFAILREAGLRPHATLLCSNYAVEGISYYSMFEAARAPQHADAVVIVANADMVFDNSVRLVKRINAGTIGLIATQGFSLDAPKKLLSLYEQTISAHGRRAINRCYDEKVNGGNRTSWDAFVFQPRCLRIRKENFIDKANGGLFHMNQNGAEAAALNAVLTSSYFQQAVQLCDHVYMWHFHHLPKTHRNGSEEFVDHPYTWPTACLGLMDCLTPSPNTKFPECARASHLEAY